MWARGCACGSEADRWDLASVSLTSGSDSWPIDGDASAGEQGKTEERGRRRSTAAEATPELLRWPSGAAEQCNGCAWRNRTPAWHSTHLTTTKAAPAATNRGGADELKHDNYGP